MRTKYYLLIMILVYTNSLIAAVRNVPLPYTTIQAALNSCLIGDTVFVSPGIYFENILWPNIEDIKLYSSGDSSNTVIDGNQSGRVLEFNSTISIGSNTEINGFKIRNGFISGSFCQGAGIYIANNSPNFELVSIEKNHFFSSSWGHGAGVYLTQSNAKFKNSSISENSIDSSDWGYGGGVYIHGGSSPIFDNVAINSNYVLSSGWGYGGGVHIENSSPLFETVTINKNKIKSISRAYGNGVYSERSDVAFTNVRISENISDSGSSFYSGGGIYIRGGDLDMTNVLINSNVLGANGSFYDGAGIYYKGYPNNSNATINLMNLTVVNNHHSDTNFYIFGIGIICSNCDSVQLKITNSIFYNPNSSNEIANAGVSNISYSNIRGGYSGVGNINSIPNFVSISDQHLNPLSLCNGAGTSVGAPQFDLENNLRPFPFGSNPDMGCYESQYGYFVNVSSVQTPLVNCFPNPVKDILYINYQPSNSGEIKCQLFNLQGIELTTFIGQLPYQSNYSIKLNMTKFKPGLYILKIEQEGRHITQKIIKE